MTRAHYLASNVYQLARPSCAGRHSGQPFAVVMGNGHAARTVVENLQEIGVEVAWSEPESASAPEELIVALLRADLAILAPETSTEGVGAASVRAMNPNLTVVELSGPGDRVAAATLLRPFDGGYYERPPPAALHFRRGEDMEAGRPGRALEDAFLANVLLTALTHSRGVTSL